MILKFEATYCEITTISSLIWTDAVLTDVADSRVCHVDSAQSTSCETRIELCLADGSFTIPIRNRGDRLPQKP